MKAFVTSIGEKTTELCVWSLERQGLDVILLQDKSTLWDKLKRIYNQAEDDFYRIDADVICNKNLLMLQNTYGWWVQGKTFEWYAQDSVYGGVQLIRKQAIPHLRKRVDEAKNKERPETYMFRIEEFHNPRRCFSSEVICGLHDYKNDTERVRATKIRRGQVYGYDWELAGRIDQL